MRSLFAAFALFFISGCNKDTEPPHAVLTVFPSIGDSTILFELNASASTDEKNYQISLKYRWDLNDDQVWDTEFSYNPVLVRRFPIPSQYLIYVEVLNQEGLTSIAKDTIIVYGRNQMVSELIDIRDGQKYQIAQLGGRWWMAECLRYGTKIDPWSVGFQDNNEPERIVTEDCISHKIYSVYSWYEALNYNLKDNHGICPDGWHIPSIKEWRSLFSDYPFEFASRYLGDGGLSGINLMDGLRTVIDPVDQMFYCDQKIKSYWASDNYTDESKMFFASLFDFSNSEILTAFADQLQLQRKDQKQLLSTVRCIKNSN